MIGTKVSSLRSSDGQAADRVHRKCGVRDLGVWRNAPETRGNAFRKWIRQGERTVWKIGKIFDGTPRQKPTFTTRFAANSFRNAQEDVGLFPRLSSASTTRRTRFYTLTHPLGTLRKSIAPALSRHPEIFSISVIQALLVFVRKVTDVPFDTHKSR